MSFATMTTRVITHGKYFYADLIGHSEVNSRICDTLRTRISGGLALGSHYFDGRYENLYLSREQIPEVETILRFAKACASTVLADVDERLGCGFWFNLMQAHDVTGRHSHDDSDELLSGVYYLEIPAGAGNLLLFPESEETVVIEPVAGRLVLFAPQIAHEVEAGVFCGDRISIGMNFGVHK